MGNITSSHDQVRFMALVDGQIRIDENGLERSYNDLPQFVKNSNSYKKHFMFTAIIFEDSSRYPNTYPIGYIAQPIVTINLKALKAF